MIFGAKEEIIPKYYDDDKPKSAKKTAFGLVRIILLWLSGLAFFHSFPIYKAVKVVCQEGNKTNDHEAAIFLVLGSNIGTCITAVIACMGGGAKAKRTALIHLTFNIMGTVLFTAIIWPLKSQAVWLLQKIPGGPEMQLAWFHVIFNVTTTLVLLPFVKLDVF